MTQSHPFCVMKHKGTGLYARAVKAFLYGERPWMDAAKPSVEEVIEQLRLADARRPLWTADLQDAEIWNDYDIEHFSKFTPNVEYVDVTLSTSSPA